MSKRDWLRLSIFALVGIVLTALFVWGTYDLVQQRVDHQAEASAEANNQQRITSHEIWKDCYSLPPSEAEICIDQKLAAKQAQELQNEDHRAQQQMARSTFWLWVLAGVQALLGVAGIYYIASTLVATREANAAAESNAHQAARANQTAHEANAVAREGNAIAKEAHFREIRPWLHINIIGMQEFDINEDGMNIDFSANVRNIGKSIALEVRCAAKGYSVFDATDVDYLIKRFISEVLVKNLSSKYENIIIPGSYDEHRYITTSQIEEATKGLSTGGQVMQQVIVVIGATYRSPYSMDERHFVTARAYGIGCTIDDEGRPNPKEGASEVSTLPNGIMMT